MSTSGGDTAEATQEKPPLIPKAELEDWGTKTTFGVIAGMLYGGCKEAMSFSEKEQTLLAHHSAEIDPLQRRNLLRVIMEEKVLRVAKGTAIGGARLGLFSALFCGVEKYLAYQRNTNDTLNVVAAGGLTAATVGFLLPGSLSWRLRSALLGSVLGATFGLPLGFIQSTINAHLPNQALEVNLLQKEPETQNDAVGEAILRLEERVSSQK